MAALESGKFGKLLSSSRPSECRTWKDLVQVSWLMLFFHALCSLQWGTSCCSLTKMQPCYYFRVVREGISMLPVAAFSKGYFSIWKKKDRFGLLFFFFFPVWNTTAFPAGAQTSTSSLGWTDYMWSPQRGETPGVSHSAPQVLSLNPQGLTASFAEVRDELIQEGRSFALLRTR